MRWRIRAIGLLAAAAAATAVTPAAAQVRDAVYRGTLVCKKLPFTEAAMREAIDVTITGGAAVRYTHVVRLRETPEAAMEQGTGKVDGPRISLQGSWKGDAGQYQAAYEGSFVRRSAKLIGTQTWTHQGRIITRSCTGVIKRPFRAFLPGDKKPGK